MPDFTQRSHCYHELEECTQLTRDLWGGTRAMKLAGARWLPMEPKEQLLSYNNRLRRSILYNGYTRAVKSIAGKPFSKPASVSDAAEEQIARIEKDADRQGNNLTQFGKRFFECAIHNGMAHIFVDYPSAGKNVTVQDQRERDIRPFFVKYAPLDVLYWETSIDAMGKVFLSEVWLREYVVTAGKKLEKVRVLKPGQWEVYVKQDSKNGVEYALENTGELTYDNGRSIPFFTFYTNETGYLEAEPALEDLAWLNLAHWQSQSDQRNILRIARCGILFGSGLRDEDVERFKAVGPNTLWHSENPAAQLKYTEHTGAAIAAGRQDLTDLEIKMEVLGFLPFVQRSGDETATAKAIDESKGTSDIQVWINDLEAFFMACFSAAYTWIGQEMPEDFKVDIFQDFALSGRSATDVVALNDMRKNRQLSMETHLREVRKRGVISDDIDIDAEVARIKDEDAAALETMFPAGEKGGDGSRP